MRLPINGCLLLLTMFPGLAAAQYQEVVPMTGYLPGPLGTKRTEIEFPWFNYALEGRRRTPCSGVAPEPEYRGFIDFSGGITAAPDCFVGKLEDWRVMGFFTAPHGGADWMLSSFLPSNPVSSAAGYQHACGLFVGCLDSAAD